MLVETICGYVGTAGLICLLLPQLYHVYRTKDASGTAWGFIGLQYVVSVNYVVYGASIQATPIVISNACNLVSVVGITACKLMYTTPNASHEEGKNNGPIIEDAYGDVEV